MTWTRTHTLLIRTLEFESSALDLSDKTQHGVAKVDDKGQRPLVYKTHFLRLAFT